MEVCLWQVREEFFTGILSHLYLQGNLLPLGINMRYLFHLCNCVMTDIIFTYTLDF